MTRQEHDRGQYAFGCEEMLKIEAAQAGHSHIEDEAARSVRQLCVQQFLAGRKRHRVDADRIQQFLQRFADRRVIINQNG